MKRLSLKIFVLLSMVAALSVGCTSSNGVPLEKFEAENGKYFPVFIEKFFVGAKSYYTDFPSLIQARSGLRMVEVKQLTEGKIPFNEANLSWSADGVYLGYEVVSHKDRKILLKDLIGDYSKRLHLVPKSKDTFLEGMVSRSIFSYNAGLRWSRDSTRYAFMSNGGTGEYNIYVGAVGGQEQIVAKSKTKDGYATWSPRTNEIAFVSSRSGGGDIYLINLDDNQVERLSESPKVDIFPEWFADGQNIVYSSGSSIDHNLMVLSRDQKTKKWKKPYFLTTWLEDDLRPTVSPNGKLIAFYASSPNKKNKSKHRWNIYVVPFTPGKSFSASELKSMRVAENVVIDLNTGPAWTPDSRKIFYVAKKPNQFNPIYGYDLYSGRRFHLQTKTRMNRDILVSNLGILSFRAQVGAWDRVFVALTNQGLQLQEKKHNFGQIHYMTE
jgi:hypothetical protein